MTAPRSIAKWRRYLRFWRADVQADIDDELRFHFDARIDALLDEGATFEEAHAQAIAEFGDVTEVRRALGKIDRRVARRRRWTDRAFNVWQDARYAVRSLRRSPGLALGILLTLALGVGANAMMFSFLDTVFLRPPAGVVRPAELRRVWYEVKFVDGAQFWPGFSYPQYKALVEQLGDRAATALYERPTQTRIRRGESVLTAQVSHTTSTFFPLLGARAALGRVYAADEDRFDAPRPVVVASDAFFERVLHRDPSAIGSSIIVAGMPLTLIGVMEPGFTGAELDATDLWVPFAAFPADGQQQWWTTTNDNGFATLLRPRSASDAELIERIAAALSRAEERQSATGTIVRLGSINRARGPGVKAQEVEIGARLAGVAAVVLLITCANVINLLLARAVRRRREVAVRLALGSSRGRLIRLLLTESVLLAAAAGVVALAVAYWGGSALRALLLPDVHWSASPLDGRVALVAVGLSLAAGVIARLVPALQAVSPRLGDSLKSARGAGVVQRSRLRAALVGAQSALSVVLLVGALLFVKSLSSVRGLDIGFDAATLVTARLDFDVPRPARTRELAPRLLALSERLATVPGVEHVALTNSMPMGGFSVIGFFTGSDSLGSRRGWFPTVVATSPAFFATTGVRIVRGTPFPAGGGNAEPALVVNEEMVRVLWPNRDPIGQCLHLVTRQSPCYRVVGVAETSRMRAVIEEPHPQFYLSFDAAPPGTSLLPRIVVVRTRPSQSAAVVRDVRALLASEFPGSIPDVRRMADALEPQYRPWRLGAALFSAFGGLALLVAAIGIYSTVSFTVAQRTHEFGVRVALGARVPDVVRLVLGEGLRAVIAGTLIGVVLALAGGRLVAALLYGVTPGDPSSIVAVAVMLLAVAAAAALAPAWRASRVDPVTALRAD